MSFQKLSMDRLRKIRPLLEKELPLSAMMLNVVNITISGCYKDDSVDFYGFSDEGSSEISNDNLFIVAFTNKPVVVIPYTVIYAPRMVTNVMLEAFASLYDWTELRDFGAVPEFFIPHLRKIIDEKGGTASYNPCTDMYLAIEDAIKLDLTRQDLEAEFQVDKLAHENRAKVTSYWKYAFESGEDSIGNCIDAFGGAGVFKKSPEKIFDLDKSNDNLISWAIFCRIGTLNALHTLEQYRGRGIGRWTMEAASKFVAQQGYIPVCEIETYNQESRRLVEKIGYKIIQEVNWVDYKPKGSS